MARRALSIEIGDQKWRFAVVERRGKSLQLVDARTVPAPSPEQVEEIASSLGAAKLPLVCVPLDLKQRVSMLDLPLASWAVRSDLVHNKIHEGEESASTRVAYRVWPRGSRLAGIAIEVENEALSALRQKLGGLASNLKKVVPPPVALGAALGAISDGQENRDHHELGVYFDAEGLLLTVISGEELLLVREVSRGDGTVDESGLPSARAAAFEEIRRSIVHHDLTGEEPIRQVRLCGSFVPRGEELESWSRRLEPELKRLEADGSEDATSIESRGEYSLCVGAAQVLGRDVQLDLLNPEPPLSKQVRASLVTLVLVVLGLGFAGVVTDDLLRASVGRFERDLVVESSEFQHLSEKQETLQGDRDVLMEKYELAYALARIRSNSLPLDYWWEELRVRVSPEVELVGLSVYPEGTRWGASLNGHVDGGDAREAARTLGAALQMWRDSGLVRDVACRIDPAEAPRDLEGESRRERIRFVIDLELE